MTDNRKTISEFKTKTVNYFWQKSEEAGSVTNAVLAIKTNSGKSIEIDSSRCYKNLFQIGCRISGFLDKRLNVFYGNNPIKYKVEL